eukprot:PhM_4_TR18479/c0_g1_i1/m.21115
MGIVVVARPLSVAVLVGAGPSQKQYNNNNVFRSSEGCVSCVAADGREAGSWTCESTPRGSKRGVGRWLHDRVVRHFGEHTVLGFWWGRAQAAARRRDEAFFLHHVGRISDKLPSSKIRESRTRTIRKTWWNTKDMRLIDAPDSFVPGGKEAAVAFREERKWGRGEYSTWANAHALRYLMRAPQPWLANIIDQEIIETMGFPWAEVPRLTAVHLRGG